MGRIHLIDAVRGLSIVLMVIHHFLFDMVEFLNAPEWLFTNPVLDVLHFVFAGLFIMLSGVSSRFSRSNIRRGLMVAVAAAAVTVATYFIGMPVYFGILHFLAFSMLFYGLTERFFNSKRGLLTLIVYIGLLTLTALFLFFTNQTVEIGTADGVYSVISNTVFKSEHLWIFGILQPGFYSSDYFPVFPWIFVFLAGTWTGGVIRENKFPKWFYNLNPPVLPQIGRKSLIIYLLHQPVLYGLTMLIVQILN